MLIDEMCKFHGVEFPSDRMQKKKKLYSLLCRTACEEKSLVTFNALASADNNSTLCRNPAFPSTVYGYWTAERRQDVYTLDPSACFTSPLLWIKDNTTNGQSPEQTWESSLSPKYALPGPSQIVPPATRQQA
jgi:hypothetical protein